MGNRLAIDRTAYPDLDVHTINPPWSQYSHSSVHWKLHLHHQPPERPHAVVLAPVRGRSMPVVSCQTRDLGHRGFHPVGPEREAGSACRLARPNNPVTPSGDHRPLDGYALDWLKARQDL